ncbi:MAG: hypothetical protein AAF230_07405, partial [Pseudomonadota bacterium]
YLSCLIFVLTVGVAEACPSFGFNSPHLSQFFCQQLDEFSVPPTRSMHGEASNPGVVDDLTQPGAEWLSLPEVDRAWRSDPAKTLKLIKRIRDAGGRPLK